jgi:hypothetical protein
MLDFLAGLATRAVETFVRLQQQSGFPEWVNNHSAVWPVAEIVHFLGLCLLIGAVGTYDLRLMGFARAIPMAPLQKLLRWGVLGFALCAATGALFVAGNAFAPGEYLRNISFLWKMVFIALAGVNLAVFHLTDAARQVEAVPAGGDTPTAAKLIGATSLLLWIGVIVFGRFLPVLGDAF